MGIRVKRAFDLAAEDDGERVLVDRYWPRGLQRHHDLMDSWCQDVAPSPGLIAWFGHKPDRWDEFVRRYRDELARSPASDALAGLRQRAANGPVTLLYGSRDREFNGARALADVLGVAAAENGGQAATRSRPPVREIAPRFQVLRLMDWGWIAFGISVPLVLLGGGEAMVWFGQRGVLAVVTLILVICLTTLARVTMQERRQQKALGDLPVGSDGRASILVPVQELGLALFGYALGFAALVLVLFGAVGLARLLA
jgi:uncharacterized protein YeaO (DUF488 family)